MKTISLLTTCVLCLGGCVGDPEFTLEHAANVFAPLNVSFGPLLHPVDLATGPSGTLFVADDGDKRIKVFASTGELVTTFGGEGDGPNEFRSIRGVTIARDELVVITDRRPRLRRWTLSGVPLDPVPYDGLAEVAASLGDHLVVANDPRWNLDDQTSQGAPLAQIVDRQGITRSIGRRASGMTPFAAHVANYVLPTGTRDGAFLWLAYLNDPVVERIAVSSGARTKVRRDLPYDWREIPRDFDPRKDPVEGPDEIPFDQVTMDIAVDSMGRAYVLTAGSVDDDASPADHQSILDVLDAGTGTIVRTRLPFAGDRIAVTPNGKKIYVLTTSDAHITVLEAPEEIRSI